MRVYHIFSNKNKLIWVFLQLRRQFYRENTELNSLHVPIICNLLPISPVHHTAVSTPHKGCVLTHSPTNRPVWKVHPAGFIENYLIIQLSSIHSHYGPYLKSLWKRPFISRDKLSEQCFIDRNTPVLLDSNPARDKHFSFATGPKN